MQNQVVIIFVHPVIYNYLPKLTNADHTTINNQLKA